MFRREGFAAGFSGALGAATLALLLFLGWRFLEAFLAISTPFVAGGAVALVNLLQRGVRPLKGKRLPAVLLVFVLFLLAFVALITVAVPALVGQAQTLVAWFSPATYRVQVAQEPTAPMREVQRNLSETRYAVKGLTNGVTYYFMVMAQDKDGVTTPVNPDPVAVTPMAGDGKPAEAPGADVPLQATAGDGEATLSWRVPPGATSGLDNFRAEADKWLAKHRKIGPVELPANVNALTAQYSSQLTTAFQKSASGIVSTVVGSVSSVLSVVLVPIVTFTLLTDMSYLRRRLLFLLPENVRESVARTASDVGEVFSGYLRGMTQVCVAYMAAATVALFVASIWFPPMRSYALLIALVGGLLYAVPYVGFVGVALLASIVALVSGAGTGALLTFVLTLFVLNQTFDNVVTPRIAGGGVGLHPLLSMLSLLLGASLFGLWGMLLAVPVAGSIQVVLFRLFPRLAAPTPLVVVTGRASEEDEG
jgi:predicted PurR-regulated permease PerM